MCAFVGRPWSSRSSTSTSLTTSGYQLGYRSTLVSSDTHASGEAGVVPSACPVSSFTGPGSYAAAASSERPVARIPNRISAPAASPQIPITRNDGREAPRSVGAEHDQRRERATDVAESVAQRDAGGPRTGGEVLGRVRVEHRHEQPDRHRGDEAEHDDDRGRDEVADHEQRDRPRHREQRASSTCARTGR